MTATIIDGKAHATALRDRLGEATATLKSDHDFVPGLAVVLVGEDNASAIYVRNKGKQAVDAGFHSETHRLNESTDTATLLALIKQLNESSKIHGILVQLPLPKKIDSNAVLAAIDPAKDVDGFHAINVGRLATGQRALTPCTPLGCLILLHKHLGMLDGKHAVIVGRSNIVGKPMAQLLLAANCTVTIGHSRSVDLPSLTRQADIVIAAVGVPELVKADGIKPGATVIDVGINRIEQGEGQKAKLVGDVSFDDVSKVAGAITPVPGGVGPMTIACLLLNTLKAACTIEGVATPDSIAQDVAI